MQKGVHLQPIGSRIDAIQQRMRRPFCPPRISTILLLLLLSHALFRRDAAASESVVLIPQGADWRYWDQGGTPPSSFPSFQTWPSRSYDDSSWAIGPAQLGYGEGDEATEVSYGPDPDTKYITTYFRRAFSVTDASQFNQLNLSVLRDDGVVVYLNGTEIYRNNMPAGVINANTLASTNVAGSAERTFFSTTLSSSFLLTGANVLAVELHQAAPDSIDLSFDLKLEAANVVTLTRGPYLQSGTTTNVIVRWRTGRESISRVRFGVDLNDLSSVSEDLTPKTEHELRLNGLSPDTRYFYKVESSDNDLAGGPSHFFVTSPVGPKPTRIWALGDPGTANGNQRAVRDAYYNFNGNRYTDLWLLLGDNAYYSGTDDQYQQAIFDMYPEVLRQSVLWPTIGNHETYSTLSFDDFPYLHIFTLPQRGEAGGMPSGTKRYYSFNYGNIHFVCLDSMSSDRLTGSPMLQWLEQDLGANTNDWLIAFWHHPPYTKGTHDSDWEIELVEMRENALPILERYGVDLVLCGHSHVYERSYLLNGHYGTTDTFRSDMRVNAGDGRINGNGPYTKSARGPLPNQGAVYVVAGSSGQLGGGSLNHPAMYVSMNAMGSMVLDINGNRLDAQFLGLSGVLDSFTILKGADPNGFRISSFSVHEYIATVTWTSVPGQYYLVQYTYDVAAPDWVDFSGPLLATENTATWSDFVPSGDGGFFRVIVMPD